MQKTYTLQILSLFNLILQPSIEYLLQVYIIHNNLQTKLSCLFTIQTKKMLSFAKNTNNIVLTNPITFNLPTLNNLIQKTSSANIKYISGSCPILKNIGIIHIKSWLTKVWSPNLTQNLLITHSHKTKNFIFIFQLIQLAKNNITLSNLSLNSYYPDFFSNIHLIYDILPSNPQTFIINSMRNNQLLFIEQITTANNKYILPWNNIYLHTNKPTKGRQPSWFSNILHFIQY